MTQHCSTWGYIVVFISWILLNIDCCLQGLPAGHPPHIIYRRVGLLEDTATLIIRKVTYFSPTVTMDSPSAEEEAMLNSLFLFAPWLRVCECMKYLEKVC